ncbi:MAG: hypothetical protein ABW252_16260 [Polyangiales bacterium]
MKRPEDAIRAPTERSSQRDLAKRRALGGTLALLLTASAPLAACNLDNPGVSAPEGTISYPVAVALSREERPRHLYVANSNFDLAFSAGSVQSYDLDRLVQAIDQQGCRALERGTVMLDGGVLVVPDQTGAGPVTSDAGVGDDAGTVDAVPPGSIALPPDYTATSGYKNARGVLCDGRDPAAWQFDPSEVARRGALPPRVRCCFEERNLIDDLRRSEQPIDSFATGLAVSPTNDRVYVPVSSRARLLYLDANADGTLGCGGETGRCRRGPAPGDADDDPNEKFPGQPASLLVGTLGQLGATTGAGAPDGTTFIATAHELGGFALFVDRGTPVLESAVTGLPLRPTGLTLNPTERLLYLATAGDINYLSRLGVRFTPTGTEGEAAPRELLFRTSQVTVTGFAQSRDIRDVAFDPRHPERLYALVRGLQESLAFLEHDPSVSSNARLVDAVRLGAGPSKVEYVDIDGRGFLLVSCYDARSVFVIDADRRAVVGVVRNLAGPFEMTYDAARKLLFVADFRASVVRVVDLAGVTDKREPPPRIIATLGLPRFSGGLQ